MFRLVAKERWHEQTHFDIKTLKINTYADHKLFEVFGDSAELFFD